MHIFVDKTFDILFGIEEVELKHDIEENAYNLFEVEQ